MAYELAKQDALLQLFTVLGSLSLLTTPIHSFFPLNWRRLVSPQVTAVSTSLYRTSSFKRLSLQNRGLHAATASPNSVHLTSHSIVFLRTLYATLLELFFFTQPMIRVVPTCLNPAAPCFPSCSKTQGKSRVTATSSTFYSRG